MIFGGTVIAEGGYIASGDVIEATLVAGTVDTWTFDATAGDMIIFGAHSDSFNSFITLYDSNGTWLAEDDDSGVEFSALLWGYVIEETGTYTIEVESFSDTEAGVYTASLFTINYGGDTEHSQSIKTAISGFEEEGYLSAGYYNTWSYEVFAGETVDVSVYSEDFDTYLEVYDSEGNLLDANDDGPDGTNSFLEVFTFPEDGVYFISVSGYSSEDDGQYNLMITNTLGGKIHMGEIVPGDSIFGNLESGYWHGWDFVINEDTDVTFSLQSDDFDAFLELFGPNGFLDSDDDGMGGTNALILEYLIDVPGTYTIYASGYESGASGDYVLEYSISGDVTLEYQRGSEAQLEYNSGGEGNLESGYYDAWLFTGSADDVVSIAVTSDDIDPYIELYGPEDNLLIMNDDDGTSFNSLIDGFVLPEDGTYEVVVTGIDFTSEGMYTISINSGSVPLVDLEEGINGLLEEGAIEYSTAIFEDGSGTFGVTFAIDHRDADDIIEQMEEREVGNSIDDWCDEVEDFFKDIDDIPKLDDSAYYEEGDETFSCAMIYEFDDFDELEEIYEAFGFVDIQDLDIDASENIDYAVDLEQVGTFVQALLSEDADVNFLWSVSVPGKLGENNADEVQGSHAVWEVDMEDTTEIELAAEKGGIPLIFLFGGAGLLVLLLGGGVGAFFLIKALRSK